jgi:putative transposase
VAPLEQIRDPDELRAELEVVRAHYNTVRLHAGIGYVTPDDEHSGRGTRSARPAARAWSGPRRRRIASHRKHGKETRP